MGVNREAPRSTYCYLRVFAYHLSYERLHGMHLNRKDQLWELQLRPVHYNLEAFPCSA